MLVLLSRLSNVAVFRKRKSPLQEELAGTVSAAKKPCVNGDVATVQENGVDEEECVDDKSSVRNSTLIVRLPMQAPNAPHSSVIVIDDSDDDDGDAAAPPSDVKPDRQQLDEQIAEYAVADADCKPPLTALTNAIERMAPECSRSESSEQRSDLSRPNVNGTVSDAVPTYSFSHVGIDSVQSVTQPLDGPSSSSASLPSPRRRSKSANSNSTRVQSQEAASKALDRKLMADTHQQTEIVTQDASTQAEVSSSLPEQQLEFLRSNVLQLLKTIVPTLTCSNLEFVDEIVVEMVRVNAESIEIDD